MIDGLLEDLETLVTCESPSSDRDAVARSAEVVAELGRRRLGASPERVVYDGRTHLRWRFGRGDRVLMLGHHDTVWPVGSLREHPWEVADGIARGPGCFDMKAGLVQMFHALARVENLDGVTILVTGDEELGAPTSRSMIEDAARRAGVALVLEASADGGALKVARKGVSLYELVVHGRAAHAGLEPHLGVNASTALAHLVLALAELDGGPDGSTVTPTVLTSGTTANTVPAHGSVRVDVRSVTRLDQDRLDRTIRGLASALPEGRLEVLGGPSHPPLEAASSAELFRRAQAIAERLDVGPLAGATVGGASDGNLAAGAGALTLDGLGAVGGGAHAPGEHVVVEEMPGRTLLLAELVRDILGQPAPDRSTPQDRFVVERTHP